MKELRHLLNKKKIGKSAPLDEKSIFFVFEKVIRREYGAQGFEHIKATGFRSGDLFLKIIGPLWEDEVWQRRFELVQSMNREIGSGEIEDIKLIG